MNASPAGAREPGLLAKAWAYYREYGLRALRHRIHRRRRFDIYRKELAAPPPAAGGADLDFRLAGPDDLDMLCDVLADYWGPDRREEIARRLERGDRAVLGFEAAEPGDLVYVSWLSRDDRLFEAVFGGRLGEEHACSRRIWVPPAHRGRGVAGRGLAEVERVARAAGVGVLWAFILRSNRASRRLHERLGYERRGTLRLGRFLGRRFAEVRWTGRRGWRKLAPIEPPSDGEG